MEYIPSFNLSALSNKACFLFSEANENSRKNFIELGRILAYNIFINNQNEFSELDYFPNVKPKNLNFINFDNILVEVDMEKLIPNTNFKKEIHKSFNKENINNNNYEFQSDFIKDSFYSLNSKCYCLDAGNKDKLENLSAFLNDLNALLDSVFSDLKVLVKKGFDGSNIEEKENNNSDKNKNIFLSLYDNKFINNLRKTFIHNLNFQISNKNILHLLMGMIILMEDICNINLNDIQKIYEFVRNKSIRKDTEDKYFTENMNEISLDYFKYLLNFFKQIKEKNSEVFEWIGNVSMGLYSIKFSYALDETIKAQESLLIDLIPESKVNELIKDNNYRINNNPNETNITQKQTTTKVDINDKNERTIDIEKDQQQKNFLTDVHNGIYEYLDLTKEMIMEKIKIDP